MLLRRAGRLVSRTSWSSACANGAKVSNNAIEVYIHRLQEEIEGPIRIATVRGLGYCLEKIPGGEMVPPHRRCLAFPPSGGTHLSLGTQVALALSQAPGGLTGSGRRVEYNKNNSC